MPQVHSSVAQNISYYFETLHHVRDVKSPAVLIFDDIKHIAVGLDDEIWYDNKNFKIHSRPWTLF